MEKMKTLVLVRHGKSDWTFEELSDIDRPLKERGVNDSYKMAGRLKKQKIIPDLILSSSATRAIHSAIIFARQMGIPASKIVINENLYMATEKEILEIIKKTDDSVKTLFVFGHNPIFTILANEFVQESIDNIPTAGMVILNFEVETWAEIKKNRKSSDIFDFPKNLSKYD
ncbi:histidine phosphatase family protein [Bacteroidota bacterium]